MSMFRFALAQHDFAVGDVAGNTQRLRQLADEASHAGASLTVAPELAVSGTPPRDLLCRSDFRQACQDAVTQLASEPPATPLLAGTPYVSTEGELANAVMHVTADGARVVRAEGVSHAGTGTESRVIDCDGVRIGVLLGDDPDTSTAATDATNAGADLLVVVAAAPWHATVSRHREAVLVERAQTTGCAIAWLNTVGGRDDQVLDGGSLLVNADGTISARAPAFQDALLQCRFDAASGTLHADDWPPVTASVPEAELHGALTRGIRDYVHGNGFRDVVLGLSGGIDSATVLALAVDALGSEHVTAVMLTSQYTSDISLQGARSQANALGVTYRELSIEPSRAAMRDTLTPAFDGKPADTTEENLQARIRGDMLMALSNKHGKLLLVTGNKSELAVGYSTLYGDMCGAYVPLKDVYKTTVYALARWRNSLSAADSGEAIPTAVIERAPSAELAADQTDQDSLPAYAELDAILRQLVEDDAAPEDVVAAGHDAETVHQVARLVAGNEFKRRQGAPGPRVTRRGFGRERDYPITSAWR